MYILISVNIIALVLLIICIMTLYDELKKLRKVLRRIGRSLPDVHVHNNKDAGFKAQVFWGL